MEQVDEAELVRRVEAGRASAFEELVRRHQRSVERLAARMLPDARDREEVCQDVFLKVFRKIDQFRGDSSLATWINSIAYRTCLNRLEGREEPVPGSQLGTVDGRAWFPDAVEAEGDSPAERAERNHERRAVRRAVRELRPQYRAAVAMYHLEGMTVAEVSEAMDLAEGTVKSHLYRARKELREALAGALGEEDLP